MPLRITPSVAEQEGQQTETEATGAPQKHHYTLNQQVGSITSFTKRETHVINMILNGYSIDEISRSLLISKKTVQSFVGIVLHKLNTTKISGIYRKKNLIIDSFARRSLHR
nr:hypothetical protein [Klebsiella pneumoniae]